MSFKYTLQCDTLPWVGYNVLETPEQVAQHAVKLAETVRTGYMPIGNLTQITEDERQLIATWLTQGASTR